MKKRNDDGSVEISGADIGDLKLVVNEHNVKLTVGAAARRVQAEKNRKNGMSWKQARKVAVTAKATTEMESAARSALGRGSNFEEARKAAIKANRNM